ncbi:hypothetical protein B0H10DRAFT_1040182 [Mycena sp. CBHHK59/15]|nr:hypothetical protein B0H10DRAFT_1040182 [Mycena sp. CBHHK59/15]
MDEVVRKHFFCGCRHVTTARLEFTRPTSSMSDDSYMPSSSPDHCISQNHYEEYKEGKHQNRLKHKMHANPHSPSVRHVKSESPSPARTPRASAIQANNQFLGDEQYGKLLDSQIGVNTFVDGWFENTGLVSSRLPQPGSNEEDPMPDEEDKIAKLVAKCLQLTKE